MKVEFDYNPETLEILDHVVRDMDNIDDEGNRIEKKPHLQIRCKTSVNYPCTLLANLTYKDNTGKFLGLDEGAAWKAEKDPSKPITIPITTPEHTASVTYDIAVSEKPGGGFYDIAGKVAILIILTILGGAALQIITG